MEKQTRIVHKECAGKQYLYFQIKDDQNEWMTVGGTGIITKRSIYDPDVLLVDGSPSAEWDNGSGELQNGVISASECIADENKMILYGNLDCHRVTQEFVVQAPGRIHVTVKDEITEGYSELRLSKLMNSIYFFPEEKVARAYDVLDFAWIPNLHKAENHVCGDHFFRSPIVAVATEGVYLALVPDLEMFLKHRIIRQAVDLRTMEKVIEAPALSYGICHWEREPHMYSRHEPQMLQKVTVPELIYGFDILFGTYTEITEISEILTEYLWLRYGVRYLADVRPQVLPFEEYGRRYTYRYELPDSIDSFISDGKECIGINNVYRRGANFHAWENDLMVAYGIHHYAEKWDDAQLKRISDGIANLYESLPRKQGAFPCVYNFDEKQYEGTLFWTGRVADSVHGYDTAAMSTTVWWSLNYFEDQDKKPEFMSLAEQYADFLVSIQTPKGAIPTYLYKDLKAARSLEESGTTALNAAVLTRIARLIQSEKYKEAALKAGDFVFHMMVEKSEFYDFETYYSCCPQPLHAVDYWTGIKPQCTSSVLWGADLFLELYRLTDNKHWLQYGEHLLRCLCLYQQVWNPSFYPEYLFGGFGVLNTDGEWNDRQQKVVPTLVNYYLETGKTEFMERAVAACRAGFALMDMEENHANDINQLRFGKEIDIRCLKNGKAKPGQGYAPENIHHSMDMNPDEKHSYVWTGLTFSSGGGLTASAYLEKHVGNVCVDLRQAYAIGIDGVRAELVSSEKPEIRVRSLLSELPLPYKESRQLIIKVFADKNIETLIVNGTIAEALGENRFLYLIEEGGGK